LAGCFRPLKFIPKEFSVFRIEYPLFKHFGEPDGSTSDRIVALCDTRVSAGFDAPIRDTIRWNIWLKPGCHAGERTANLCLAVGLALLRIRWVMPNAHGTMVRKRGSTLGHEFQWSEVFREHHRRSAS
jgi:hypothetical protein